MTLMVSVPFTIKTSMNKLENSTLQQKNLSKMIKVPSSIKNSQDIISIGKWQLVLITNHTDFFHIWNISVLVMILSQVYVNYTKESG